MCKNAASTAANLMKAIEPTLVELLTAIGVAATPDGIAAINAFNAADQALAAWVPGTTSETVIEVIDAFTQVFNTLPIPTEVKGLADIISAGIVTVIGVISANSPAPVSTPVPDTKTFVSAAGEEQAHHVVNVVSDTTAKVQTLVPGFKRALFTAPDHQYRNAWNKEVEKAGSKYASLKQ